MCMILRPAAIGNRLGAERQSAGGNRLGAERQSAGGIRHSVLGLGLIGDWLNEDPVGLCGFWRLLSGAGVRAEWGLIYVLRSGN